MEEDLGAYFGEFFGGDGEDALEGVIFSCKSKNDWFAEDDAEVGFDLFFPGVKFLLPFLVALLGGVVVEIEFDLDKVHDSGNSKFEALNSKEERWLFCS